MFRPPVVSNTRQSIASGAHMSSGARILAKKKEYDSVEGLEHNAIALRETFLTFARQMKSAQEGAQCESHVLRTHEYYYNVCLAPPPDHSDWRRAGELATYVLDNKLFRYCSRRDAGSIAVL